MFKLSLKKKKSKLTLAYKLKCLFKYHFRILICIWYKNSKLFGCVISFIPILLDAFEINSFTLKKEKNINEETYL